MVSKSRKGENQHTRNKGGAHFTEPKERRDSQPPIQIDTRWADLANRLSNDTETERKKAVAELLDLDLQDLGQFVRAMKTERNRGLTGIEEAVTLLTPTGGAPTPLDMQKLALLGEIM